MNLTVCCKRQWTLKEIDKRCAVDSAGLSEVLMVTCCELRDEPPLFTKELEFYWQVERYYQFHMKPFPLLCLLVSRFSINLWQGNCRVTDEFAIWFHGCHFNSESVSKGRKFYYGKADIYPIATNWFHYEPCPWLQALIGKQPYCD